MSISPARTLAHSVLETVRRRDAFVPPVLSSHLASAGLDDRDAGLGARLVYGTLQMLGSVDYAIDHFAQRPSRIEPKVRDILRVAAWEVLFGQGSGHAAVSEAVDAVRAVRPHASGFANALLRRISADPAGYPWDESLVGAARTSLMTGHPEWLVRMWESHLGTDAARAVMEADNTPAGIYVLRNPFGHSSATIDSQSSGCPLPGCERAAHAAEAVRGGAVAEGAVIIQDAAAQLPAIVADPRPGNRVIDACAGRGGKSLGLQAAAVRSGGVSEIFAVDVHEQKLAAGLRRLADMGVPDVTGVTGDATALEMVDGVPREADVVLVDAPCSGLGTLRRHPMKRWRVDPAAIESLARLQSDLLASASSVTGEGGAIVYATCTISPRENEDVVRAFLASERGRGFRVDPVDRFVPDAWHRWLTEDGWFQSLPEPDGPDGHFIARLVRD